MERLVVVVVVVLILVYIIHTKHESLILTSWPSVGCTALYIRPTYKHISEVQTYCDLL